MIQLFDDQERSVAGLRASINAGHNSPLLVSPTGSGKTVMFSYLTSRLVAAGRRVVAMAHREELLEQISGTFGRFDVPHGMIGAGSDYYDRRHLAHVAGVFTVKNRLDRIAVPDYVVGDEAHHFTPDSSWGKVIAHWRSVNPRLRLIGVTATPERLDGTGLGAIFDDMVMGPTTAELIALGRLSKFRLYGPSPGARVDMSGVRKNAGDFVRKEAAGRVDKPTITGDAVEQYAQRMNGAPSVAFCASIEHAEHVAEAFRARGFRAVSIDGKLDKAERKRRVEDFGRGQVNVLVSCDLISEGFDVPGIVGAILLRPTESLALYLQQVGRALRVAPGKEAAIINDHVGNCAWWVDGELCAKHGFPDDERDWSLDGARARKKAEKDHDDVAIKQCPKCKGYNKAVVSTCRDCGHVFVVKARVIEEVAGDLQEVDRAQVRPAERVPRRTVSDLMAQGYSEGRANHVMEARAEKAALRNRVLELSRRTGDPLSPGVVKALKPKQLRELVAELELQLATQEQAA